MRYSVWTIGIVWMVLFLCGCAKDEVVTSYQEVKAATAPIPVTFSTYVGSVPEEKADTRADYQYLSFYHSGSVKTFFKNIPFLSENRADKSAVGLKVGHAAYNNYIVGVYGFWHEGSNWSTDKEKTTLNADFMTNQPLLHLWDTGTADRPPYWDYSPTKYWPNSNMKETAGGYASSQDKVTFVSYYPFQDYEDYAYYRDGTGTSNTARIPWEGVNNPLRDQADKTIEGVKYRTFPDASLTRDNADLTNIVPPAKDATGVAAYTFGFQQKPNVEDHVDFMIGMNEYTPTNSISQSVTLNLRHSLTALFYLCSFADPTKDESNNYYEHVPNEVKWTINSITITGLKDRGTVVPAIDGSSISFNWSLDSHTQDYTVFTSNPKPNYSSKFRIKASYDPTQPISSSNVKYEAYSTTNVYDWPVYNNSGGQGYKWAILALPQITTQDCYVIVDYNLTYKYTHDIDGNELAQPLTVAYDNCVDKRQLKDLTLPSGKSLNLVLKFYLKSIKMDAVVAEWPDDEYLDIEGDINIGS